MWRKINVMEPGAQYYKYAGKERDAESSLDYFEERDHGSSLGGFMQPDPVALAS